MDRTTMPLAMMQIKPSYWRQFAAIISANFSPGFCIRTLASSSKGQSLAASSLPPLVMARMPIFMDGCCLVDSRG